MISAARALNGTGVARVGDSLSCGRTIATAAAGVASA